MVFYLQRLHAKTAKQVFQEQAGLISNLCKIKLTSLHLVLYIQIHLCLRIINTFFQVIGIRLHIFYYHK